MSYLSPSNPAVPTITVDARQCGAGKTFDSIFPILRRYIDAGEPFVVAVPSKDLQQTYQRELRELRILNEDTCSGTVISTLIDDLQRDQKFICITHAAFLLIDFVDTAGLLRDRHLVIDELFSPYNKIGPFNHTGNDAQLAGRMDLSALLRMVEDDGTYTRLRIDSEYVGDSEFLKSNLVRELTAPNFAYEILSDSYRKLMAHEATQIELYGTLTDRAIRSWKTVHIAAADFDNKELAHWLQSHGLDYVTPDGHRFLPHSNGHGIITAFSQIGFDGLEHPLNFTGGVRADNPQLLPKFREHVVRNIIPGEHPIVVRNNNETGTIVGERRMKHNAAGLNEYRESKVIVIESAIRPGSAYAAYMNHRHGLTYDTLLRWHVVNPFYQLVMRLAHRNPDYRGEWQAFIADGKVANALLGFFEPSAVDFKLIPSEITMKRGGMKVQPLTQAQRQKKSRLIKSFRTQKGREPNELELAQIMREVHGKTTITDSRKVA